MDGTVLGQALQAAQQHVPTALSGLAGASGYWTDRALELMNSQYARNFRTLMLALRIFATLGLLCYGIWFMRKTRNISLNKTYDTEAKRQTEMARAMADNTLWLGNQRGIVPLIWDIWMTLLITYMLTMGVKYALENKLAERALHGASTFADARLKAMTPEMLQRFVPPVESMLKHMPMPPQK
jgi:hypothetical protein